MNDILGTPSYVNLLIISLTALLLVILERFFSSFLLKSTLKRDKFKGEDSVTARQGGLISLSIFTYLIYLSFLLIMGINIFKMLFTNHNLNGEWHLLISYIVAAVALPLLFSLISRLMQPNEDKINSYRASEFTKITEDNAIDEAVIEEEHSKNATNINE